MSEARSSAGPERRSDAASQERVTVDVAFRRAALIQDSKLSVRLRRLNARRRQGTN
ncbi:MAG: hypothetical protein JWP74_3249 [Marmoricola sp.]|nr:hypothetical protein [Marmoricola sp.]